MRAGQLGYSTKTPARQQVLLLASALTLCISTTNPSPPQCKLADNTPVVLESAPDAEQPAANAAATEPAAEATTAEPAEDATTAPAEDATTAPAGEEAAGKTDDGSSDIEVTDDAEPDLSPPSPTALLESGPEAANPAGNETAAEPETTTETETSAEPLTKPTAQPAAEVAAEPEPNATPSGATSAPEPEPEEAEATDATEPAPESPKPAATSAPAGAVTKASPEAPEAPPAAEAPAEEEAKPVHVINTSGTHQPWTMAGGVDAPAPSAGAAGIMSDSDILFASARDTARAAADAVKDPASSNWGTDEHGLETEPVVWTVDIGADGKCPAGYYVDARVCRRCAQGHVRAAEETTCQICPPGERVVGVGGRGGG